MTGVDLVALADAAEREMRAHGTAERAVHERAYLKSSLEHAGVSLPVIRSIATRIRRAHPAFDTSTVFALADELWKSPLHERRMLAVMVLQQFADQMTPSALAGLERLVRDSHTWALVDGLAGDVAARIVLGHPDDPGVDAILRRWGADEDFWVRRSALLAHLHTLGRRGSFVGWDRFVDLADSMLDEREFFVRKAIGWVLREAGKRRPGLVADFLRPRVTRVSGVTVREAVRYLEPADRDALMAAYTSR
jgi:3-methyladenine DNA glycosylase AlkD